MRLVVLLRMQSSSFGSRMSFVLNLWKDVVRVELVDAFLFSGGTLSDEVGTGLSTVLDNVLRRTVTASVTRRIDGGRRLCWH